MCSQLHRSRINKLSTNGDIQSEQVKNVMLQVEGFVFTDSGLEDTAKILEVIKDVVKDGSHVLYFNKACSWYTIWCTAVMVGDTGSVMIIHKNQSYIDWFCEYIPVGIAGRIKNVSTNDVMESRKYDFIMGCLPLPVPDHVMDTLSNNGILMVLDVETCEIVVHGKHPSFVASPGRIILEDKLFLSGFREVTPASSEVIFKPHEQKVEAERKQTSAEEPAQSTPAPDSQPSSTPAPDSQPSSTPAPDSQPSTTPASVSRVSYLATLFQQEPKSTRPISFLQRTTSATPSLRRTASVASDQRRTTVPTPFSHRTSVATPFLQASSLAKENTSGKPLLQRMMAAFPFFRETKSALPGLKEATPAAPVLQRTTSTTPVLQKTTSATPDSPATASVTPALQCPVCDKHLTPPTGVCSNGHSVCCRCKTFIARCPTCKTDCINNPNVTLDQLLKSMGLE